MEFYIVHFTKGSLKEAKSILEKSDFVTNWKDVVHVAFFGGMTLIMVLFAIWTMIGSEIKSDHDEDD